jgi:phenylalanyl-tRNA synthetase beta chain
MKISYNWLKEYVNIENVSPQELAVILTNTGLEVEGLEKFDSVKGGLEGIVTGEVITCKKHPNADRLSITTVDIGQKELLPIICGAPNVAAGQKVLIAKIGTTLYKNDESFTINKTKIRGELSEGMICAEDEVGLGTSHEGIMVLGPSVKVGVPAKKHFDISEDWVFEIGLTPNRTDATSHLGVARDIVAALNQQKHIHLKLKKPRVDQFKIDHHNRKVDIIIEDVDACPRYSGLTITDVKVKGSPDWMQNRLNAVGIRPINNIVDITNYVLMELGHPLHAFDADRIKEDKVVIRKAYKDEKFITLDEVERDLVKDDLLICNAKDVMCIAGVFGGTESGVTENTNNIFLESAFFTPGTIRKTSKHHGLQTDASFRFERGADPNITIYALKRAALLIKEIGGGKISCDIVDVYPKTTNNWIVDISYENIHNLVGKVIEKETIRNILQDLEIKILKKSNTGMQVSVPTFRYDVRREADIIEEILRIYGYNNIEIGDKVNASLSFYPKPDKDKIRNSIADYLCSIGISEIMNNSLTKSSYADQIPGFKQENNVRIYNPLSGDLNVLRQSLLFGGLESVVYNHNRKITDLKLFEFGTTYFLDPGSQTTENPLKKYKEALHLALFTTGRKQKESWNTSKDKIDFYFLKGIANQIFKRVGVELSALSINNNPSPFFDHGLAYYKGQSLIAELGLITQSVLKSFDIKQPVIYANFNWDELFKLITTDDIKYSPVSRFPEVRRDLALLIDQHIGFSEIEKLVYNAEKKLISSVNLFDIYEGNEIDKGKKSYAISIILQDKEKTLTDKVVDKTIRKVVTALETNLKASIR